MNYKGFITVLFCANSLFTFSQWNTNPSINTAIAIAAKSQQNIHSTTDTKNGAIIVWDDNRNNTITSTDIYAQRIKSNGFERWATSDVLVCDAPGIQKSNNIITGGIDGSCIITWEDGRAGNYDIYAQKIDSSGNILWGTNGIVVCNRATNQKNPKIISDNSGGAIIVWEDSASFYFDIYAQKINNLGIPQWTSNGVPICVAPNQQQNPTLDIDGLGGAIITWQDKRSNVDYDIYAQKINGSGAIGWASNGIIICNATNTQSNPRIEPDGANGAVISWIDKRNAIDYNIFAQRVNSAGSVQWAGNGVSVCSATNNQSAIDMKYLGSTGIIFTWKDNRVTTTYQIYAQLIDLNGVNQLAINGIQLSTGLKAINPNTIKDGLGGAIVAWQDSTAIGWDIKSQKLNSTGSEQWSSGGVIVCNATNDQTAVSQVLDGNGGAIYTWEDRRNGTDAEIYAHHLFFNGSEVVGINELNKNEIQSSVYPTPANEILNIKLNNNLLDEIFTISIIDVLGKEIICYKNVHSEEQIIKLNVSALNSGVYFYSLKSNTKKSTGKLIISK